jgi:ABC-2 type transport system permease protein
VIRAFLSGLRLHMLQLSRSSFDLSGIIVWPIVFATIAYYMYGQKSDPRILLGAAIGATMMAMWSTVILGSSGALELQRFLGTLELLVAAPVPLAVVLASITSATGVIGVYSLTATLLWSKFLFGISLHISDPLLFGLSFVAAVAALASLGLIVASTFVFYRGAFFLGIALQSPVYLASGLLVPVALLPTWVTPVSWILAPTWGVRALRAAALGGNAWPDIGMCALLTVVYLLLGVGSLRHFERLARSRATLRLA